MHNPAIIGAPVTLFLGAGASRPLGKLLMTEFIDEFEKNLRFGADDLVEAITKEEKDLEYLFEELQEWTRKRYFADQRSIARIATPDSIPPASMLPGVQTGGSFGGALRNVIDTADDLERDLRRAVFGHYSRVEPTATIPLYKPLFDLIFEDPRLATTSPLVIFTTNYDPAIERFCEIDSGEYALEDGFFHNGPARRYEWRRSQFDDFKLVENKRNIILFKLHGSADWIRMEDATVKSPPFFAPDGSGYQNILIYPAKRKVAIDEPFFTAYDYYQRCLERARFCIVIGYSFRDYDALTKLMSAAGINPNLRLLVIDPQASGHCKMLRSKGIPADPLAKRFGDPSDTQAILNSLRASLSNATASH